MGPSGPPGWHLASGAFGSKRGGRWAWSLGSFPAESPMPGTRLGVISGQVGGLGGHQVTLTASALVPQSQVTGTSPQQVCGHEAAHAQHRPRGARAVCTDGAGTGGRASRGRSPPPPPTSGTRLGPRACDTCLQSGRRCGPVWRGAPIPPPGSLGPRGTLVPLPPLSPGRSGLGSRYPCADPASGGGVTSTGQAGCLRWQLGYRPSRLCRGLLLPAWGVRERLCPLHRASSLLIGCRREASMRPTALTGPAWRLRGLGQASFLRPQFPGPGARAGPADTDSPGLLLAAAPRSSGRPRPPVSEGWTCPFLGERGRRERQ